MKALSHIYIGNVDKADGMEAGMFPLTRLEACMTVALEEAKKEILTRLTSVIVFIEWNSIPLDLRYDMVIRTTCFRSSAGLFQWETENADKLAACGSKAVFW